jgi:HD superfamily phosphohydrolase
VPYDKVLQENIEFSELEEKIVNLEEFQKLKFVKQNGFAYRVYPYARNNRLDHSIGTMYWSTHLYKSIMNRDGPPENDNLQAIRLAALVHDIGHGPFSHALELLFDRNPELFNHEPWSGLRQKFGKGKPHELLTLRFAYSKTFEELIPRRIRRNVRRILRKRSPLSLVISGDLDADRLDYLMRDSHHSGLPFGLNVKPIFNEFIHQNLQTETLGPAGARKYFLVIDSKGVPAYEQLLMARYAHYCYIAYEPRILQSNLTFVSALEKGLWESIKKEEEIALAVFYIFTELTDDKLLDLDFSDVEERKRKLLNKIKTPLITQTFQNLKAGDLGLAPNFVRLCSLGKQLTFNFFRRETPQIRELETTVSKHAKQTVKMHFCLPEALTTRTRVYDEGLKEKYNPSLVYDYSPVVRALEQKMYLDCGILVSSAKPIQHKNLVEIFGDIRGRKTDFDMHTCAILKYIGKVRQSFPRDWKWKLRRARIFEFLNAFADSFCKKGLIEKKIEFVTPWYSEEVYELLQKLEFLDVLDEDFNINSGDGFIPHYVYSIGEYGEQLIELLDSTLKERHKIEMFVKNYIKRLREESDIA